MNTVTPTPKKPPLHLPTRLLLLLAIAGAVCGAFGGIFLAVPNSPIAPSPSLPMETPLQPQAVQIPTPTPTPEPTPTPYDYALPVPQQEPVDDLWFQDAVFVGDSRTDGLQLYGGITEGTFICYKGLTSFEFDNKKCIKTDQGKLTALEALSSKEYGKVFLMLGLNELGYTTKEFAQRYAIMLDQIVAAQPNAMIYIQPVVPINNQKAQEKKQPYYITNEKIAEFNTEISRLAEEKQLLFLDVSQGLTDETGQLPYDHTTDGVHFSKGWYQQWYTYLKAHTVDPEELEAIP